VEESPDSGDILWQRNADFQIAAIGFALNGFCAGAVPLEYSRARPFHSAQGRQATSRAIIPGPSVLEQPVLPRAGIFYLSIDRGLAAGIGFGLNRGR